MRMFPKKYKSYLKALITRVKKNFIVYKII